MKNSPQIYVGLDFIKLIAAFMVVIIHTRPGAEFGVMGSYIYKILPVWGVPFFFCCSGFFLFRQLCKYKTVLPQLKRLIVFYILWSVIYMPLDILYRVMKHDFNIWDYLINFFVFGSHFHLWFIIALIISIVFISLITNDKILLVISVLGLLYGILGSSYYGLGIKLPLLSNLIENIDAYDKIRRIISFGIPFTVLGYLIAKKIDSIKTSIKDNTGYLLIIAIFIFLVEMVIVYYFKLQRDVFLTFCLLPLVFIIFLRGLFYPFGKNVELYQSIAHTCRLLSNAIYFIHPWIILILTRKFHYIFSYKPTLTCLATFMISALIGYIIIKINNPFLNRLIQ